MPDTIDITHMRSMGLQPGEELLPESGERTIISLSFSHFREWRFIFFLSENTGDDKSEAAMPAANEDIVSKLADMGFNYFHCQKAAINTSNVGVEEAMTWLLSHMDDPGLFLFHLFLLFKVIMGLISQILSHSQSHTQKTQLGVEV